MWGSYKESDLPDSLLKRLILAYIIEFLIVLAIGIPIAMNISAVYYQIYYHIPCNWWLLILFYIETILAYYGVVKVHNHYHYEISFKEIFMDIVYLASVALLAVYMGMVLNMMFEKDSPSSTLFFLFCACTMIASMFAIVTIVGNTGNIFMIFEEASICLLALSSAFGFSETKFLYQCQTDVNIQYAVAKYINDGEYKDRIIKSLQNIDSDVKFKEQDDRSQSIIDLRGTEFTVSDIIRKDSSAKGDSDNEVVRNFE